MYIVIRILCFRIFRSTYLEYSEDWFESVLDNSLIYFLICRNYYVLRYSSSLLWSSIWGCSNSWPRRTRPADEDVQIPDQDEPDQPASEPSLRTSPSSSSSPTKPQAAAAPPPSPPSQPSLAGWDVTAIWRKMMWLAGEAGLSSVIDRPDAVMPTNNCP